MRRRRRFWAAVVGVLALPTLLGFAAYRHDMQRAYARITGKSKLVASPYGQIEYSQGGSGPPVLVIHGSGGGFDHGELLARAALGERFHWIAPSRFGYLRSTFHPGASFDDQAHAYAWLLDHLGLQQVAVVAIAHGGPGTLLFALLHPERVSSLTLISAGVASASDAAQAQANSQGDRLMTLFQHDPLYWAVTQLFRKRFIALMGASDEVSARLTPAQRQQVDEIIDAMNPASPRSAGAAFDNRAAMPNERIASIRAPTLIFHARDDSLQLYRHAEFAASRIAHARLVGFDKGGHLLLVVEQSKIRELLQQHLIEHAGKPP
jgi:pimeloyl-ACP methyl ester carboxylesterase